MRVRVAAASVNPIDWKLLGGLMGDAPTGPTVPGFDAAGVVDEVGEGVTGVKVGDDVEVFLRNVENARGEAVISREMDPALSAVLRAAAPEVDDPVVAA